VAAPVPAGGLEQVVQALAVGHQRRGMAVAVAAILLRHADTHPLVAALRRGGVTVFEIRVPPRGYLSERAEVRRVIREFRPDVVHTHGYRIDVVERPVAARLGVPTVTTVHGPSMNGGLKGAFYEWLQRRNYRRFDAVVAVSAALRDTTLADGVAAGRLHLVPNAWGGHNPPLPRAQARSQLDLPADAPVVGWVGRMIPVKGGDIFLEALRLLPDPKPVVAMIGHGIEEAAWRRQAELLGLRDVVRFYPGVTDAGRLFPAFDVWVLSSRSEGLPVVMLEAMAARTPIVATRVGGVAEVIADGESGIIVEPENPASLADGIRRALADPRAAAERAGRAAQRLEAEFALEPWLDRYESVYRSVLRSRAS
jgi:glycosyltransferase involved in cell wall biosynthesis